MSVGNTLTRDQLDVFNVLRYGPAPCAKRTQAKARLVSWTVARQLERRGLVAIVHGEAQLSEQGMAALAENDHS